MNPLEKATFLNMLFESEFSKREQISDFDFISRCNMDKSYWEISKLEITVKGIEKLLKDLKDLNEFKAPDQDNIKLKLLKDFTNYTNLDNNL